MISALWWKFWYWVDHTHVWRQTTLTDDADSNSLQYYAPSLPAALLPHTVPRCTAQSCIADYTITAGENIKRKRSLSTRRDTMFYIEFIEPHQKRLLSLHMISDTKYSQRLHENIAHRIAMDSSLGQLQSPSFYGKQQNEQNHSAMLSPTHCNTYITNCRKCIRIRNAREYARFRQFFKVYRLSSLAPISSQT